MRDFRNIINILKTELFKSKKAKVLDKDIAELLGMSQAAFATLKKRNVTPYESILLFCQKEKLCCSEVFFD